MAALSGYPNDVVIKKFKSITGIEHRRYAEDHLNSSDLAYGSKSNRKCRN
jgi:hypothetical protein